MSMEHTCYAKDRPDGRLLPGRNPSSSDACADADSACPQPSYTTGGDLVAVLPGVLLKDWRTLHIEPVDIFRSEHDARIVRLPCLTVNAGTPDSMGQRVWVARGERSGRVFQPSECSFPVAEGNGMAHPEAVSPVALRAPSCRCPEARVRPLIALLSGAETVAPPISKVVGEEESRVRAPETGSAVPRPVRYGSTRVRVSHTPRRAAVPAAV